ncbi:unnamed protein product, partial [Prorocentrum cordatum]
RLAPGGAGRGAGDSEARGGRSSCGYVAHNGFLPLVEEPRARNAQREGYSRFRNIAGLERQGTYLDGYGFEVEFAYPMEGSGLSGEGVRDAGRNFVILERKGWGQRRAVDRLQRSLCVQLVQIQSLPGVAEARPDCSSLRIFLGELGCRALVAVDQLLGEVGAVSISLVYHGSYFRPMGLDARDGSAIARASAIEAGRPRSISAPREFRFIGGGAAPEPGGRSLGRSCRGDFSSVLASACEKLDGGALEVVPGASMCVICALTDVDLDAGRPSQAGFASGPYSCRHL